MEELINELDIFVNEKAVLSAQIRDIESKRNELAKERNTKKAQNKINNDEDVWSEVNCLGKQISDLGNQSQWFQNQINSKLLRVREQAFIEIDNLIAESVRKSRIISEQIEENRDNLDPEEIYELTDNINEIGQSMARIMFAKRLIKHNQIVDVINLFSTTEIEESQEQSEQINEIIEKQEIENKEENDLFLGDFKAGYAIFISDESLSCKECLCFNIVEFEKFKEEYIERYKCEFFQPEDYIIYFIDYNSFRLIYNTGKIIEIDIKKQLIKQKIIDVII